MCEKTDQPSYKLSAARFRKESALPIADRVIVRNNLNKVLTS